MTGCSVEYNLILNEDSSVNEEVIATERTDRLESRTKLKGDQATNYLFNMFKRSNEDIDFTSSVKDSETIGTASTIHDNINEYSSKFSSDLFEKVEIITDDDLTTILAKQTESLTTNSSKSFLYDDIVVNITIPFVVDEHNADSVSGNTYTWNIKKDGKLKDIKISYKDKELPNRANIKINEKNYSFRYEYIIIGVIVLTIVIIIISVVIKSKKNNVV
jgi:hypothetical protein